MDFHEFGEVELGLFDHLDLADVDILEGVDSGALLFDFLTNGFSNESLDEVSQLNLGGLVLHDFHHLSADTLDVGSSGVAVRLCRVSLTLCEGDGEQTEDVSVGGLHFSLGLNQSLPLADQRAKLVSGHVHTVEVGKTVTTLGVQNLKLDLAEALVGVLVKVTKVNFADTTLQLLAGDLGTSGLGNQGLTG